ncbi:hypothetical protein PCASD_09036 [Puccinia coronata f. sp. avenae]|uniref:CxC1-like cysteine cluster associated with KDZ transposases domain-containing protein n=1 Tax=Puccinia coronata f. sp. avenae TaxID=200324 RepID=A0A2N5UIM5_9BASI|nr:hypothetical protein PCASD_09036 [Puccinia coronata f. sp. avenae]
MSLTKQQKLARDSCPACFGPTLPTDSQPLIICLNGNFQHRHHFAASKNYLELTTPGKFIHPDAISQIDKTIHDQEDLLRVQSTSDQCADLHKAANDKRNQTTWKACDDTGLMGCCCRHDAAVYMANITGGGEKRKYPLAIIDQVLRDVHPDWEVRVLYDIGCTLKKFVSLRQLFPEAADRLHFGTSVFHSYVHNWKCQLEFSPRLNIGWGLSDGEGLERLWSYLATLVSPLRYSTRSHRLGALQHKIEFHNKKGIVSLIHWIKYKQKMAVDCSEKAKDELASLSRTQNPFSSNQTNYTRKFFETQWQDQRSFQQTHTSAETEERECLAEFLDRQATLEILREQLMEADERYPTLFQSLIETVFEIADNQEQQRLVEINFTSFPAHLLGSNQEEQNARLLIWHAKSKLYAHAVQLHLERQPLYRGTHIGTTLSTKILAAIERRKKPVLAVIKKVNDYRASYLTQFAPSEVNLPENRPLTYHSFTNISLDSAFWQDVYLFHSQAPWAKSADVRTGIQAFLMIDRSNEELFLIKNELNSATSWAVELHGCIKARIDYLKDRVVGGLQNEDAVRLATSIDMGKCEDVMKVALVISVLEDQLAKHEALMRSWAGDVHDLWTTLYGSIPELHPWFQLVDNLPLPTIVGNTGIDEEEGSETDVDEDEVDPVLMQNLLNIGHNDQENPNGRVGNGSENLDV